MSAVKPYRVRALDDAEAQGLPRHLEDADACAFVAAILLDGRRQRRQDTAS